MTEQILFFILPITLILIFYAIEKTRNLLKGNLSEVLIFVSGYLFLLADIKNDNKSIIISSLSWEKLNNAILILGVITSIISIFISATQKQKLRNKNFTKLKNEYFKFSSDFIRNSFDEFFKNSSNNGRVSMYLHQNNKFILIGRYSNNPNYNKKGRKEYSDNEGLISKGWLEGTCVLHGIPEWRGQGKNYYQKVKSVKNISLETVKDLNMKSRSFYVKRIDNEDSRTPHGIIVLEQAKSNAIDNNIVEDIFEKDISNFILHFKGLKSLS